MHIDLAGIRRRDPRALRTLMAVVRRSAHVGCNKIGADHLEEDVAQELFLLFLNRLIDRFDESYNAEPILIESARRIALSLLRKSRESSLDETLQNPASGDINTHDSLEDVQASLEAYTDASRLEVDPIDRKRALKEILVKFPGVVEEKRRREKTDESGFIRKRRSAEARALPESCRRLREIRLRLGRSQEEFADLLGIPTATLLSYEYGRTPRVRDDILARAEELYELEKTSAEKRMREMQRPMREVVREWAEMLAIDPDDYDRIAEIIGVSRSTVHRWMEGSMHPKPKEMNRYIQTVREVSRRVRAAMKALNNPKEQK